MFKTSKDDAAENLESVHDPTDFENYKIMAEQKIQGIRTNLISAKTTGMSFAEKKRLRNIESAQKSRLTKMEQVLHLKNLILTSNSRISTLKDIISKSLSKKQKEHLGRLMDDLWQW